MKYLSKYKLFESSGKLFIPLHFIELHSIGHVLDPKNGLVYPTYRDGYHYDADSGSSIEYGDVEFDEVSDKDMDIINSLWKSVEPIMRDKINFDIIDKLKDLSLDYVDDGFILYYSVYLSLPETMRIAHGAFSHQTNRFTYGRRFPENFKKMEDNQNAGILYKFMLHSRGHHIDEMGNVYDGSEAGERILPILKDMTGYDNIKIG